MKCVHCSAATRVLETRVHASMFPKRVRECVNGHREETLEVPFELINIYGRSIERIARSIFIARNPDKTALQLARMLNITPQRVNQIRSQHARKQN